MCVTENTAGEKQSNFCSFRRVLPEDTRRYNIVKDYFARLETEEKPRIIMEM